MVLLSFIESCNSEKQSYLTLLQNKFCTDHQSTATLSSTLAGMGGIGKTTLALQYAHKALEKKEYDLIYWFVSETEFSLIQGYRHLLDQLNISNKNQNDEKVISFLKEYVKDHPEKKCLFIYDNVPEPNFLEDKVLEGDSIHRLITSRFNEKWTDNIINLDLFSLEDSAEYLFKIIGI
ncbi:MAG: hypothetical protein EOP45_22150, partial [Sphingobacteriaceae bacterium]